MLELNLNTSYVDIKHYGNYNYRIHYIDLNTSYVDIKPSSTSGVKLI